MDQINPLRACSLLLMSGSSLVWTGQAWAESALPNPPRQSVTLTTIESLAPNSSSIPAPVAPLPIANPTQADLQALGQVTSVSQLADVQPTDWAYQALASLVEKYGCIAGYPDGTFRGNRAATRFELAAALNACLDVVSDRFATKEDLAAVRRLQQEFATELATIRGRVDNAEARIAALEATQFSTTTKLQGEAILGFEAAGGGNPTGSQPNPIAVYRTRLNLVTSFTGQDMLITGLQAFNFQGALLGGGSVQNTLFPGTVLNSGSTNLGFQPQFAGIDPNNLANSGAYGPNSLNLYKLLYIFPVVKSFTSFAFVKAETTDAFPQIIPWAGEGQGALSRFAGVNPIVRLTTGTSGIGVPSGLGFIWNPNSKVNLTALYGVAGAANPGLVPTALDGSAGTPLGSGFFPSNQNSFIAAAQATFSPLKTLDLALNFSYSQHAINVLGTGLSSGGLLGYGGDVFSVPGLPYGAIGNLAQRVQIFGVGGTGTYRVTPNIALSGYAAGIFVNTIGGTNTLAGGGALPSPTAGAVYTSFMGGVQFSDAIFEGNTAALIIGQPLYLESTSGIASSPNIPGVFSRARPFQVEAYYRFRITDNISVTPGAFVIFNPEFNSLNETTAVGLIRSTFTF
ncbi:iron uptake porin [Synechococcus sp. PCC 6312]|uniref:iron uptake porin n=1 Tax=Synechococcus sp. (strain ATCC 27167 / PCC 6312) TaxID=195253 RepID=UPI00029EEDFF|nr:iron uptake porin [Synechococcus sp. PCC 6312]AFY62310.1 putative S-layer protein [Synechococcus sp. PCC 6312]